MPHSELCSWLSSCLPGNVIPVTRYTIKHITLASHIVEDLNICYLLQHTSVMTAHLCAFVMWQRHLSYNFCIPVLAFAFGKRLPSHRIKHALEAKTSSWSWSNPNQVFVLCTPTVHKHGMGTTRDVMIHWILQHHNKKTALPFRECDNIYQLTITWLFAHKVHGSNKEHQYEGIILCLLVIVLFSLKSRRLSHTTQEDRLVLRRPIPNLPLMALLVWF